MAVILKKISKMNILTNSVDFSFNEVVYNEGSRFGPRLQQHLQIVVVHRGEAAISADGEEFQLSAGQGTLLRTGVSYHFQFSRHGETQHTWCDAKRYEIDEELSRRISEIPNVFPVSERMEALIWMGVRLRTDLQKNVQNETRNDPLRSLRNALGQALFQEVFFQAGIVKEEKPPLPESVGRAVQFIETGYEQPLDAKMLAEAAALSPQHLSRLFRDHLDCTPTQYLWRIRLQHGVRLLRDTGLSIAEIADRCGFQTPYHFSRMVKQHYELSPRGLRQQAWKPPTEKKPGGPKASLFSDTLRIMPAGPGDLERIYSLDEEASYDPRRRRFLEQAVVGKECWLASKGAELLGFAVFDYAFYGHGFIHLLLVAVKHRRHGFGSALVRHVEKQCRGEKLFTSTNSSNAPMQRLLGKLGYARSGMIENLDPGDPEWVYFKRLGQPADTAAITVE